MIFVKNLIHSSLNGDGFNMYAKFQVWDAHNEIDIQIQKIKVKKIFFRHVSLTLSGNGLSFFIYFTSFGKLHILLFLNSTLEMWS